MTLVLHREGAVAHLIIARVDRKNAFSRSMWEALPGLLEETAAQTDVRALVLRSSRSGGVFCAGADIHEMAANADDAEWCVANQEAINRAQFELARFPLPTVALVEGDCIGGGCGLAMACDIRVATPAARFGITPARLGLAYPLHDVKLLVDLVGPGQAKRLLFTGSLIDAEEAQRIGLVELIERDVSSVLGPLLSNSSASIQTLKSFIRRVQDGASEDDASSLKAFADAFSSADFAEGTDAFRAKRKPDFSN